MVTLSSTSRRLGVRPGGVGDQRRRGRAAATAPRPGAASSARPAAPGSRAPRAAPSGRRVVAAASKSADRVGELVEPRDRLLKRNASMSAATPATALWHRWRSVAAARDLSARRGSAAAAQRVGRPAATAALDEAPGALDAGFGPFQVALGRAVRQHEPARGVGAVSRR